MKNRNLSNKGLSISQAQSISNLCYQRAVEISSKLTKVNNLSQKIELNNKEVVISSGHPMPDNLVALLKEKAELHACQAFLMENIKLKDHLLKENRVIMPDTSKIERPEQPAYVDSNADKLEFVDDNYGWSQLTNKEYNEFLEAEAYAAHIGQYIHNSGHLGRLRDELTNIPDVDWMEVEKDKKTIVFNKIHHTPEQLLGYHEELAKLHREYEQKVNYYKAKVKNLTTQRNAEIAKHNSDIETNAKNINNKLASQYDTMLKKYENDVKEVRAQFEIERQNETSRIAALRIDVDPRFQRVIDMFLNDLKEE